MLKLEKPSANWDELVAIPAGGGGCAVINSQLFISLCSWSLYKSLVSSFTTSLTIQNPKGRTAGTMQSRKVSLNCP